VSGIVIPGPVPPKSGPAEVLRIAVSMTVACAIGAIVLGFVYMGTDRYATAERAASERRAVTEMLSLDSSARVRVVSQYLDRAHGQVVYRRASEEGGPATRLVFALDGALVRRDQVAAASEESRALEPLGRIFVATRDGHTEGFVVEGQSRGYKNVIRFFVALDSSFSIAGVRVVEHEEDPGLGAETATAWFQGQFIGRGPEAAAALDVTRDPMPEDWRSALAALQREPVARWRAEHAALVARESARRIYAVTGATITSRAVTDGVRATVDHFRRRWRLIEPQLGGAS
jgi:electron transport complex protein RnfG